MSEEYEVIEVKVTTEVKVHVIRAKDEDQAKDFVECNPDNTLAVYLSHKPGHKCDDEAKALMALEGVTCSYPYASKRHKYGQFNPSSKDFEFEAKG